MKLIVVIIIGLIALGVIIGFFARSFKKEKGYCSKCELYCNDCKSKNTGNKK